MESGDGLEGDPARWAVYYLPPPEGATAALAAAGAAWLGWDVEAGREVAHPALPGLAAPVADLTATPRRYGFHATVKPPFRLAAGTTPAGLRTACAALCAGLSPVRLDGLVLADLDGFLALVPAGDTAALEALAARAVAELDAFRAAALPEETARRRAAGLTPRQEALLVRWGYPYVMEEFGFHMTLTGRLDLGVRAGVAAALEEWLAPALPRPLDIGHLALAAEGADGRFRLVARWPLGA
jgi:putative phosphonate metabolism protein